VTWESQVDTYEVIRSEKVRRILVLCNLFSDKLAEWTIRTLEVGQEYLQGFELRYIDNPMRTDRTCRDNFRRKWFVCVSLFVPSDTN